MTQALRYNDDKPHLSQLFHFEKGLEALAAHCDAGRAKYPDVEGVPNWTLGGKPDQEYLDSAARHLAAIVRGETHDVETGTLHAAAVAWNMLALLTLNCQDLPVQLPQPEAEEPEAEGYWRGQPIVYDNFRLRFDSGN